MAEIRKAEIGDLERVEYICRMTADEESIKDEKAGRIVSLIYSTYYIEEETDNCFVLVDNGEVVYKCSGNFEFVLKTPKFEHLIELLYIKDKILEYMFKILSKNLGEVI